MKTSQRTFPVLLLAATLLSQIACGGGTTPGTTDPGGPADSTLEDAAIALDEAATEAREDDTPAADPGEGDAPVLPDAPDADDVVSSDAADAFVPWPDATAGASLAWVWEDPNAVIQAEPTQVALPHLTDPDGLLLGEFANVFNCLNKEGGPSTTFPMGGTWMTVALCAIERTVKPDPDGNYLSVRPPEDSADPDDPFAEVQMYWHMNRVHDYFKGTHGETALDRPLRAIVNVQIALTTDTTGWMPFDNAAFMPRETIGQLGQALGVTLPFDEDAIVFGQGQVDFAYDGDVIYHEYTHAMVGGNRLLGVRADEYGPDMGPLSLNEALADYFTTSLTDDPVLGGWALGQIAEPRRMDEFAGCPADIAGESHHDSAIFSSALWEIRTLLGAATADAIVYDALQGATTTTGFDDMTALVVAQAALLDPPRDAEISAIFATHGLPGCNRLRDAGAANAADAVFIGGTQSTGLPEFSQVVPSYVQFSFEIPEGTQSVRLSWQKIPDGMSGLMSMFGYPETVDLDLALKPGSDPIRWTYDGGSAVHDAVATVSASRKGDDYAVTLAGSCLTPGRHVFQYLTDSMTGGALGNLKVEASPDAPAAGIKVSAYDCTN